MRIKELAWITKIAIVSMCVLSAAANAAVYQGKGKNAETSYLIYIPDKLNLKVRQPWILGFSPAGNGQETLAAMKKACDDNGWILVASNNSRNGLAFDVIEPLVLDTIASAIQTISVDPARMYAGGLSGGSMVTHWFVAKHPTMVKGIVINCGMMESSFKETLGYPYGKAAVFMTNPQDFRYNEIRGDFQYVKNHGWRTSWMEFPGGHQWAPPNYYSAAFKWLNEQAISSRK